MEKPNAVIFIDGNNFYFRLKDLTAALPGKVRLLDFNYRSFATWLVGEGILIEIRYYIGALKITHPTRLNYFSCRNNSYSFTISTSTTAA